METLSYAKEVKANKEHICNFCGMPIGKNSQYITSTHKNDGTVYDWKTHTHCAYLATKLKMYEDCDEGVTQDDFQESICSAHDDIIIEMFTRDERDKFKDVIAQARHAKWRDKFWFVLRYHKNKDGCTIQQS